MNDDNQILGIKTANRASKRASKNTRFDFFNLKTQPLKNKGLRPKQKKTHCDQRVKIKFKRFKTQWDFYMAEQAGFEPAEGY